MKITESWERLDILLVIGIACLTLGIGLNVWNQKKAGGEVEIVQEIGSGVGMSDAQVYKKVRCEAAGEVKTPGVYEFDEGDRVEELIKKAGGLNVEADKVWVEKNINLASKLRDGEKIYIPKIGENTESQNVKVKGQKSEIESQQYININEADIGELDKLEGVGEGLAKRIIEYREKSGGFKNIEEIKLVSGIGDKLYEKIKDKISI